MSLLRDEADAFERRMRDIRLKYGDDPEACHAKMDELMCETLEHFGCDEGVKIYRELKQYYLRLGWRI